ncbi:hypothetical protein DL765_011514 [Monosporascus sp. GIB2]|nr:hypothetical protein DL765_011514 [Monosporascus sp. GIB2]
MKFGLPVALLAGLAAATPTPTENDNLDSRTVQKRATITDACDIGFCKQNGGTTGGRGGTTTTVADLASFTAAVGQAGPAVVVVDGKISGAARAHVTSNKSIIGKPGSSLTGVGLAVLGQKNVTIRNMKISKVLADYGDGITVQKSSNVWIDSCDISADLDHNKDYYDGLIDVVHASEWVTISNTYMHDHWKGSLVGHPNNNGNEDTGHLHVTYAGVWFDNINSRAPMYRCFLSNLRETGINTRAYAQLLIESTAFENPPKKAIFSNDNGGLGGAVVRDVDLGGGENQAPAGTLTSVPYSYQLLGSAYVKSYVRANAGQKLTF